MTAMVTQEQLTRLRKLFLAMLPLYVLVPVGYWLAFSMAGIQTSWSGFGLGALGWWVALILRAPVALGLQKTGMTAEKMKTLVVGFSGPAEEIVRWALIGVTSAAFPWAASVGQGWAAIEVLFAVVQGFALLNLAGKTDEKAEQARAFLAAQGLSDVSPVAGVIERVFASGVHLGFTLLVAKEPWLVLALVPLHSMLNLLVTRYSGQVWKQETVVAVVGTLVMVAALLW